MGGATSKLKENVWEKADGKLTDPDDTVDGSPPTTKYDVYHLTKRGVNQREFDITDSESNLIYTTRQVPGTIACFDLLGKEIDDYRVRVNVDIARRYWTLYRFEQATFEGQKPDKHATERLVAERLEEAQKNPLIEQFNTPFLFRKAVIIVSWSRYMAVSLLCGPPTPEMIKEWEDQKFAALQLTRTGSSDVEQTPTREGLKGSPSKEDGNGVAAENTTSDENNVQEFNCSPVSSKVKTLTTQLSDVTLEDDEVCETGSSGSVVKALDVSVDDEMSDVALSTSKDVPLATSTSVPELKTTSVEVEAEKLAESGDMTTEPVDPHSSASVESAPPMTPDKRDPTASEVRRQKFRDWAQQQSKHFRERSRSALEKSGVINNPVARNPREGVVNLNKPMLLCQEIYTRIIGNHQTSRISKKRAIELLKQDIAQHEKDDPEGAKNDEEDAIMGGQEVMLARTQSQDSGDGELESKEVEPEDEANLQQTEQKGGGDLVAEEEQPLVGYWLWENTLRIHKMKMHVARGSDLALHVILAIIVNQVRYERNALAMTV